MPSTTAYALLGLLNLRSWTTYELTRQVQRSLHWFWPRAERKLYQEPKLLADAGLATATPAATGKRPRTVYEITDAGREILAGWLSKPVEPRSAEFAAMIKVFFADAGTLDQLERTLDEIETECRGRLATLAGMAEQALIEFAFPERLHLSALSLRLQVDQEIAILRWTQWARTQIAGWRTSRDVGDWDTRASVEDLVAVARRALGESTSRPHQT